MMTRSHSSFAFVLVTGSLLVAILACRLHWEEKENITPIFEQYYLIDPPSLLDAIARGDADAFVPVDTRPESVPPSQYTPVTWSQADYLRIVEALFEHVFGETLDGWYLNSMDFSSGCTEVDMGLQQGGFRLYKNETTPEGEIRVERSIDIDPRSNSIFILELEYSPRLVDWGKVDLGAIRYPAIEALRIAEREGGQEKRLAVQNNCYVDLLLVSDAPRNRGWWHIWYWAHDEGKVFEIWVNPMTGKVKKKR